MKKPLTLLAVCALFSGNALSTTFTDASPSGLDVSTLGVSTIGGIVADLEGLNGNHVVSQLSASSLFSGFGSTTNLTIGTQTGFNNTILGNLGGGLTSASFRFTLFDGDQAAGEFDFNDNTLLVNGFDFGNWSSIITENTTSTGTTAPGGFSGGGFRNQLLDTGWFTSTSTALLNSLFTDLTTTETLTFVLADVDPGDNFLDFTQGIDNSLINSGQGPTTTGGNNVPEPASLALLGLGLMGLRLNNRKQK